MTEPDPLRMRSLELLEDGLRKTMLSTSGAELDAALAELGWADMLSDMPELAIPLVFRLLGETGSHASVLNDVVQQAAGRELGATPALPYAGGGWVVWDYARRHTRARRSAGCRCAGWTRAGCSGWPMPAGPWAGGWSVRPGRCWPWPASMRWTGSSSGEPIAWFQAVRHRLAETLVAIEGAEATLSLPGADNPDLTALLAKAAAGKAALTAAKHCQQVLGGIGFTAEHDLHHHVEAGPGARRIAWQLKGTHPEGRSRAACPRLGAAPGRPLDPPRATVSVRQHADVAWHFAVARAETTT